MQIGVISPHDWGLAVAGSISEFSISELAVSSSELDRRIYANTYEWLPQQFNEEAGAFYGFYSAPRQQPQAPQTVNLIAPWQLLAAYDRYQDEKLLVMARRAADWVYTHLVVTHPMSVVIGGVRAGVCSQELWTKFTAEFIILNAGLYRRTGELQYLERARQSAGFLIQSARHNFAPRYNEQQSTWQQQGWNSFGRIVEAFLELEQITGERDWQEQALNWGRLGLTLQAADGSFYLIDDDYFNTDLAADELRGLIFLYEQIGQEVFLQAARRFADWLLTRQRADGAWPLTIDRDGHVVVSTVGPGDVSNIAIALLRLHFATGEARFWEAAMRAFGYALRTQAIPESEHPYLDDPRVRWGFWSWDPYYDYTLSADQSTHHVRGMMFLLATYPLSTYAKEE